MTDLHASSLDKSELPAAGLVNTPDRDPMQQYRTPQPADTARPASATASGAAAILPPAADVLSGVDRPVDPNNPSPDTWLHDKQGHVTRAGNEFTATYNLDGKPVLVQMEDQVWAQTKPGEVQHDWYGRGDQKWHRDMIENVKALIVNPDAERNDSHGTFAGIEVKVDRGEGGYDSSWAKVYESPEHQQYVANFWRNERAAANQTRRDPKN
jgi:hypothetical protein